MKPASHQSLLLAHASLPRVSPAPGMPEPLCLGIVICILTWFKVCSDNWHAHQSEGKPTSALVEGGIINMTADCTFDAILKAKGADTAKAIQQAIGELVKLNPALNGVLQPGHFGLVQALYDEAKAHPDSLHKLVTAINGVSFECNVPSFACGAEFAAVITAVCKNSNAHARALAPLCAKLLQPQADEVVLDLTCGQGHLLLACAKELADQPATKSATEPARLRLHGMAHDVRQWSLAKLLFSLSGLPHEHIQHANPLLKPFDDLSTAEKALVLGGADIVVMAIPTDNWTWCNALAFHQQDPRFQHGSAPSDSRLALVWQALAALKPETGRMALMMPINVLDSRDGQTLRQHLVANNLLDAVICPTGLVGQMLLMIRSKKSHADIAFIQAPGHGAVGTTYTLQAYQCYQAGQIDPCLIRLAQSTVAANDFQLNLQMFGAVATDFYARPMNLVFPA